MSTGWGKSKKYSIPPLLFAVHLMLNVIFSAYGWVQPFELFNLLLLTANLLIALFLVRREGEILLGTGIMLIIASHALIGHKIATDSLMSGAILMCNILIFYVGVKIFENLSSLHFLSFVGIYFLLFFIFIIKMENAEPLFLLSLMGLAATARNFKLLAYFLTLIFSFTFFQPYAWQAVLIFYFFLYIIFSLSNQRTSPVAVIFLVCGLSLVFFVLLPVLVIVLEEYPRNIINILKEPGIRNAFYLTAFTASVSTVILALFCIPLAYGIHRLKFSGKTLLLSLIDIPIIIPQSAAGIALLKLFGKQQYLGEIVFNVLGIRFDGTIAGICIAQIFVAMPFLLKSALAAFGAVPPSLEHSARTLGSSSFGSFWRIALPLASQGIFIGTILAWSRAAGEFGAVLFIAPFPETAPIAIYNRFTSVGLVQAAPAVASLVLFSVAVFFLLQLTTRMMPELYSKETA